MGRLIRIHIYTGCERFRIPARGERTGRRDKDGFGGIGRGSAAQATKSESE